MFVQALQLFIASSYTQIYFGWLITIMWCASQPFPNNNSQSTNPAQNNACAGDLVTFLFPAAHHVRTSTLNLINWNNPFDEWRHFIGWSYDGISADEHSTPIDWYYIMFIYSNCALQLLWRHWRFLRRSCTCLLLLTCPRTGSIWKSGSFNIK